MHVGLVAVIFEYKIRLEKSLQQEKNDHQQMKEDLQSKVAEEKILKDKTLLESMNKYTSLQQQHKLLKVSPLNLNIFVCDAGHLSLPSM